MSLKTLTQLTSTTAAAENGAIGAAYRRHSIDEARKNELKQKILQPSELAAVSAVAKTVLPAPAGPVAADLPQLSAETLIDRTLIDPAPDEWNFFGPPDDESYNLLLNSIIVEGLMNPITLWKRPTGRYMILSGHTRESVFDELYQASENPKWLKIPAKYYEPEDLTENDARRIIILANIAQRAKETPLLRIRCYGEYARLTKERAAYGSGIDINEEVAKVFGIHRSTVFFYRRLNNLIDPLLDRFCAGKMTRAAATVLCGLSLQQQKYLVEQGYIDRLDPAKTKKLKNAKTNEDIQRIFTANQLPEEEPGRLVKLTVPKKEAMFLFTVPKEVAAPCRQAILQAISSLTGLTDKDKNQIISQLERSH